MTQYRITVGDSVGQVTDKYPGEQWEKIADIAEERGYKATFERRTVIAADEFVTKEDGWLILGNKAITQWQVLAQFN